MDKDKLHELAGEEINKPLTPDNTRLSSWQRMQGTSKLSDWLRRANPTMQGDEPVGFYTWGIEYLYEHVLPQIERLEADNERMAAEMKDEMKEMRIQLGATVIMARAYEMRVAELLAKPVKPKETS